MPGYKFYLWFSRISGLLVLVLFLAFYIGEGLPGIMQGNGNGFLRFLPFAAVSFMGYIIAWFRPYAGGLLMIIGALVLGAFFVWNNDLRMALVFGLPSLMIGLSFVAAARKELV